MFVVLHLLRKLTRRFSEKSMLRLAIIVLMIIVLGSLAFWYFEPKLGLPDSVWWAMVTVTTVGYGDISPVTLGGRIVGVVLMLSGIGLIGTLTATIAGLFLEDVVLENRGMKGVTVRNHYVICGWNSDGGDIIAELGADRSSRDAVIVILADLPEAPVAEEQVRFIKGTVSKRTMEKANLAEARAVFSWPTTTISRRSATPKQSWTP